VEFAERQHQLGAWLSITTQDQPVHGFKFRWRREGPGGWLALHRTHLKTFLGSDINYRRRKAIHRHRFSILAREAAT